MDGTPDRRSVSIALADVAAIEWLGCARGP